MRDKKARISRLDGADDGDVKMNFIKEWKGARKESKKDHSN